MVVHAGDTGFQVPRLRPARRRSQPASTASYRLRIGALHIEFERVVHDYLGSLMFDKLFERFPNIRMASIENGAGFLAELLKKLRQCGQQAPGLLRRATRSTSFRRNVWINPFWEDDINEVVDLMGADRVIFGSTGPTSRASRSRSTT